MDEVITPLIEGIMAGDIMGATDTRDITGEVQASTSGFDAIDLKL
jgi:hypothetical protein